jgi:SpoVK/Ycf46/Vps4 family AAA+-type ATPase
MSFLAEMEIKRICQNTCDFLIITEDEARRDQTRNYALKLLKASEKGNGSKLTFTQMLEYDLQRQELRDHKNNTLIDEPNILQAIDKRLLDQKNKTFVLIHYVFMRNHADNLSDYLAAWAHDGRIFNTSTIVVFASDASLFNETLRRLCYTIELQPPTTDNERLLVMQKVVKDLKDNLSPLKLKELNLTIPPDAGSSSRGLNQSEVQTATMESLRTLFKVDTSKFTQIKIEKFRAQDREYIVPSWGFERIGGYEFMKHVIRTRVCAPLKDPAKAASYGVKIPRGITLVGPPGTGKTIFAKALAKEVEWPMFKVTATDQFASHVGESERMIKQLQQLAEANAPDAMFIDEADAVFPRRGSVMSTDSGVSQRVENSWLEYLGDQNRQAFVIIATNFIDAIDDAILRPGRCGDVIVPILYPDIIARTQIFDIHIKLNGIPTDSTVNLDELSKDSFMMSGADIENWCKEAAAYAHEQSATNAKGKPVVTIEHFKAVRKYKDINIEERMADLNRLYESLKKLKSGVNTQILEQAVQEFMQGEKQEADRMKPFMDSFSKFGPQAVAL